VTKAAERVIVALDVPGAEEARRLVDRIGPEATHYKVGSELFTAAGPELVRELVRSGKRVFLDLKLHDIPNTVGRAAARAADLGARFLTLHASGGREMVSAAGDAVGKSGSGGDLRLLAVTALTSLGPVDVARMLGAGLTLESWVRSLAREAIDGGAHGLVCSPREVAGLRERFGSGILLVTPGIRPAPAAGEEGSPHEKDDQKRTATAAAALAAGADYLVVGRPVTRASDPAAAFRALADEASGAATARE
jgi:orotidine-5'-phosphate decarboxylase